MAKLYRVYLSESERTALSALIRQTKLARRKQLHARILLKADESSLGPSWKDCDIAWALEVGRCTVERVRQAFVEEGFQVALQGRPSPRIYQRKLDGDGEAKLIALACAKPPQGCVSWTLELLSNKLVELKVVESISQTAVRDTLKKMNLSLGSISSGASRPRPMPSLSVPWKIY
jgi:hypothetical protein